MRPPPRHRLTLFHLARHRQPTLPLWMLLPRLPPRCRTPRRSLQPVIQPTPLYLPYSVSVRRHSPVNASRDPPGPGLSRRSGIGRKHRVRGRPLARRRRAAGTGPAPPEPVSVQIACRNSWLTLSGVSLTGTLCVCTLLTQSIPGCSRILPSDFSHDAVGWRQFHTPISTPVPSDGQPILNRGERLRRQNSRRDHPSDGVWKTRTGRL